MLARLGYPKECLHCRWLFSKDAWQVTKQNKSKSKADFALVTWR